MEEPGLSKLVSVNLSAAVATITPPREPAPAG
jgi:hypothetical protein